ncbi:MAG: hypothetical protein PVF58_16995 [Candidatus Methanofastidiosia archaeon]|jgi:hypothetical protein
MEKVLTESEKKLLNALGENPYASMKDLVNTTPYKWVSTIAKKIEHFKERHFFFGPFYDVDYGKLCRNPLHPFVSIMEIQNNFESVISYLECIEPLMWTYPVLSPRKELLAGFISSNDEELKAIFQLLKDTNIITSFYTVICHHKFNYENPNLFGDPTPPLNHLLDSCTIPDMSFGQYTTEWNTCDIAILPYLLVGYKNAKLIEILKAERKLNKIWTYEQIKYSYTKMVKNGLIEKQYVVYPFPKDQCVNFLLAVRTEDIDVTLKVLCNFAKGARVFKSFALYGTTGVLDCVCHPLFVADLLHKLDSIDDIKGKALYQRRSITEDYVLRPIPELKYFDFDTQMVEYPYQVYAEKIKEKIDSE